MIWQLVKRDPAWQMALIMMAGSATVVLALPRMFLPMFGGMLGAAWLQSQPSRRATVFQTALPLGTADLLLARALALLAGVWLPLGGGMATLLLTRQGTESVIILAEIGAALSVLMLAALSSRLREAAGSQWAPMAWMAVLWGAAWPVWKFVPWGAVLAICAVLCGALSWRLWSRLPEIFEVLPGEAQGTGPSQAAEGRAGAWMAGRLPATVWLPVLRAIFPLKTLVFLPLIVIQFAGGQWLYVSMFGASGILSSLAYTEWVRALPVRRGPLLAVTVLPWVLALMLNLLLNGLFVPGNAPLQFDWLDGGNATAVRPPLEFWRPAPGGNAPRIEAPWGETWQPKPLRLVGMDFYNPYAAGTGNSRRFFEWQYLRATEAVYGEGVAFADSKRLTSLRPRTRQARFIALNMAATTTWLILLVNWILISMHWRVVRIFGNGQLAIGLVVAAPVFGVLLVDILAARGPSGPVSVAALNALLLRLAEVLPGSLPAMALAAWIPAGLLFWSATMLVRGAEPPPVPAKRA